MVTIIQGPKTYMETLLKYVNDRIVDWDYVYKKSGSNNPSILDIISELEDLKRKIEGGDFEEELDKTITPPKVVL